MQLPRVRERHRTCGKGWLDALAMDARNHRAATKQVADREEILGGQLVETDELVLTFWLSAHQSARRIAEASGSTKGLLV